MPRPPKHVSPDTLGGRIRAARERLQLSLADVAEGHYSTSLISQIERNRADPSHESLRFLAKRLALPLEDLETLAQQHRALEIEPRDYKTYEELRVEATQLLNNKEFCAALTLSIIFLFRRYRLSCAGVSWHYAGTSILSNGNS